MERAVQRHHQLNQAASERAASRAARQAANPDQTPVVHLRQSWCDQRTGRRGYESLELPLRQPWFEVIRPLQFARNRYLRTFDPGACEAGNQLSGDINQPSRSHARHIVCGAGNVFRFACATGLRPSMGYARAYPASSRLAANTWRFDNRQIPGQDNVSIWFEAASRFYLLIDEPFREVGAELERERALWCEQFGYVRSRPAWAGLMAPGYGTVPYLFARAEHAARLASITATVEALLPIQATGDDWSGVSVIC